MPIQRDPILDEVFAKVSKTEVAAACRVSKAAVSQWKRIPDPHVRTVYDLLGRSIPLSRLRSDLAEQFGATAARLRSEVEEVPPQATDPGVAVV